MESSMNVLNLSGALMVAGLLSAASAFAEPPLAQMQPTIVR
jgi:hypothetical protein